MINKRSNVDVGDILFGMIGTIGNPIIVNTNDFAIKNVALIKNGGEISNEFLIQLLKSSVFDKYIRNENVGNTQKFLSLSKTREFTFPSPSNEEQFQIGKFFKRLDDAIALYQNELDILKKTKKGLLQKMFPKEGESVPEVRFPGFTDDWEQRKLGEMADFSKGNCYSKSDLTDEGEPVILYGRLYTKYETVISTVDTFTAKKENSVISKGNEVIIPASGETAEDISRAAVVAEQGIIIGGDLNIVRPYEEIDSIFLALTISNGKQQKELSRRAQGKSIVHLHNSDLKEVDLIFPRIDEQIRIGFFFKQLDNTIALHQRELDVLKKTKKAFLQKMFINS